MTAAIGVKQSHKAWERLGSHFKDRFLFHYFEQEISLTIKGLRGEDTCEVAVGRLLWLPPCAFLDN